MFVLFSFAMIILFLKIFFPLTTLIGTLKAIKAINAINAFNAIKALNAAALRPLTPLTPPNKNLAAKLQPLISISRMKND